MAELSAHQTETDRSTRRSLPWRVVVNATLPHDIPLLAHQGGWDEIVLVLAPIAIVAALLWVARRRVTRASAEADDVGADSP